MAKTIMAAWFVNEKHFDSLRPTCIPMVSMVTMIIPHNNTIQRALNHFFRERKRKFKTVYDSSKWTNQELCSLAKKIAILYLLLLRACNLRLARTKVIEFCPN